MYIPLLLSITLGTRISETLGLHYQNIDFTSLTVYIEGQIGRSVDESIHKRVVTQELKPKTRYALRSIPLPSWVADELLIKRGWYENKRNIIYGFSDEDYICCNEKGIPFVRNHFRKAISEFLGHHSPDFTDSVYVTHEEKIYDCTILSEIWDKVKPDPSVDTVQCIPFDSEDVNALLN